ncbi:hypothetical protein [Christiangramia sediminis]|uniref:Uncharacterized protein n=1 Tax=Christiangramia sediminis TaxID=2881336 RepID=A0A9X1RWU2_9FLAO|nr:hypothetical protein [Christiangramia sediminis]MCB7479915.1 hypothetical protein [Christiangramia sediminis]
MRINFLKLGVLLFLCISCKDRDAQKEISPEISESNEASKSIGCYSYTMNQDTIYLSITILEDSIVEGNLTYKLYEKDKNQGRFSGKWIGDSLFADYEFESEGAISTREIFFFKTDSGLVEGYGPVKDTLNKIVFQEHSTLILNENIRLEHVDCD